MARPTAYARGACPHHQHPARIAATGRRLVLPHAKALDLGTRTAQDRSGDLATERVLACAVVIRAGAD